MHPDGDGRWRLHSNTTYEVLITHYQPDVGGRPVGSVSGGFDVATDDALLHVIGDKHFEVASRYDAIPIRLSVPPLSDVKETVLTIRPTAPAKAPRANLRFEVGSSGAKRIAGGAAAITAVVLAAIPGLMSKSASFGDTVWFPILAAAITFAVGWWALLIRKSG